MYKMLDGDQVVVFGPARIYRVDDSGVKGAVVGAKVVAAKDILKANNSYDMETSKTLRDVEVVVAKGTKGALRSVLKRDAATVARLKDMGATLEKTDDMTDAFFDYWREKMAYLASGRETLEIKLAKGGTHSDITLDEVGFE